MKSLVASKFTHPAFTFYLRRSTYIHLVLVVVSLLGGKLAFDIGQATREKNLELIQASVRVDMVAMPKYTLNELKNLSSGVEEAKPEEVTPEVQKVETKVESKVEEKIEAATKVDNSIAFEEAAAAKKRQDFLSKLKSLGNKKIESNPKAQQKAEKGLYGENESALKNLVLSGNKLSQGSQMYGDGGGAELTAFQAYASRLPDLVRPHWKLPSFLMDKNLKCRVRVWLSLSGEVTRATVYQSSGDTEYDQRAIEAIKAAAPFPVLKEEFGRRALNGDLLLGFPL
ncbi:MAG: TonB family protein [Bacteriovoracaceae bacterium]|nr:TonB family protein [Bacteriovoracaceae bacterium]